MIEPPVPSGGPPNAPGNLQTINAAESIGFQHLKQQVNSRYGKSQRLWSAITRGEPPNQMPYSRSNANQKFTTQNNFHQNNTTTNAQAKAFFQTGS